MRHIAPVSKVPHKCVYVTQGLFLTIYHMKLDDIFGVLQLVMPNKVPDRNP